MDRSSAVTGKSIGGGVCFYVNQRYCKSTMVRDSICTPDLELLTVSLHPFYLPREFSQLSFTLVYIHSRASAAAVCDLIAEVSNRLDTISPDAPKFILGHFNNCRVDETLKTYEHYVTCPTTVRQIRLMLRICTWCFQVISETNL